jgi:hypothetical protein
MMLFQRRDCVAKYSYSTVVRTGFLFTVQSFPIHIIILFMCFNRRKFRALLCKIVALMNKMLLTSQIEGQTSHAEILKSVSLFERQNIEACGGIFSPIILQFFSYCKEHFCL